MLNQNAFVREGCRGDWKEVRFSSLFIEIFKFIIEENLQKKNLRLSETEIRMNLMKRFSGSNLEGNWFRKLIQKTLSKIVNKF